MKFTTPQLSPLCCVAWFFQHESLCCFWSTNVKQLNQGEHLGEEAELCFLNASK